MTPRALPVWRSVLFVPVNVEKFVAKAAGVGADALKLDLEDSIGPSDKDSARKMAPDVARRLNEAGDEVMVRVNRPWRLLVRDLEAVVGPHVSTIVLPKADSPDLINAVSEVIGEIELERGVAVGSTQLMLLIESAEGYLRMPEIAKADPRVVAITLGSEDFGLSLGMTADPETLYAPATQVVVAASAAGVIPWGFVGSIAEYKDIDRLRGIVQRSKRLGFRGASCIHPNQVRICNEEFGPSEAEVAAARRLVAAYDEALAQGRGSVEIDGKMVDIPIAERAKGVIRLADALAERARSRAR